MPKGELFINGVDAYTQWGISLTTKGLSALMTPSPTKELIENKSRLQHGKSVIVDNVKLDERSINLPMHMTAKTKEKFLENYGKFCEVLEQGRLDIKTSYQPNVVYRTTYVSCNQFSEYNMGIAYFTLVLNEPNPSKRNIE